MDKVASGTRSGISVTAAGRACVIEKKEIGTEIPFAETTPKETVRIKGGNDAMVMCRRKGE